MKKLVIGILAHVDAGKTTLSESMLYLSGKIRTLGRVDNKDAYLDTYALEKARGITIFSKQAIFNFNDTQITLIDTPGHVDFSAEMERTLQILDYAILVISATDGIQGHTLTLWTLLKRYKIPVFIFVNKMDRYTENPELINNHLKQNLGEQCVFFNTMDDQFYEEIAVCDDDLLEKYFETAEITTEEIQNLIINRQITPCFLGSALKLDGVEKFLRGITKYSLLPQYPDEFGAKIFKITRDEQNVKLTHMKITGGTLSVTQQLGGEKVNQIRLYSGLKFEAVHGVEAGEICAVVGLNDKNAGDYLGFENSSQKPMLEPVLSYKMELKEGCDPKLLLPKLRQLEEEAPELHILWIEEFQEIQVQMMGEVHIEVVQNLIYEKFDVKVKFSEGSIVYKETIKNSVEGVGHFEPLRHYAEIQVLLEPLEEGAGIQFAVSCDTDKFGENYQKLALYHMQEKPHKGVLTGSPITDIKITLVGGIAHKKHTEGGDFREATFRAIRQGLMEAESVLLEPYYKFKLEVPENMIGRAMHDIEKMHGDSQITQSENGFAILEGVAPVATMQNYQREVVSYTKGLGRLFCVLDGYKPCHNAEQIIADKNYSAERDTENPVHSVFCKNGSGFLVDWHEVKNYMHLSPYLKEETPTNDSENVTFSKNYDVEISLDEIMAILNKAGGTNTDKQSKFSKVIKSKPKYTLSADNYLSSVKKKEYLLVDGYNIIFGWDELKSLAELNLEAARTQLMDILSNYQGMKGCEVIVVFDAYRVKNHYQETFKYHNIYGVYTKEAQTADHFIEKFVHDKRAEYKITVVTSDGLQQVIIRSQGANLYSSTEFKREMLDAYNKMIEKYERQKQNDNVTMASLISDEVRSKFK